MLHFATAALTFQIVIVLLPPKELLANKADFLRWVGNMLKCVVLFERDDNGEPKIEPFYYESEVSIVAGTA